MEAWGRGVVGCGKLSESIGGREGESTCSIPVVRGEVDRVTGLMRQLTERHTRVKQV